MRPTEGGGKWWEAEVSVWNLAEEEFMELSSVLENLVLVDSTWDLKCLCTIFLLRNSVEK